jgi:AraC-like DNA-binding protein
MSRFEDHSLPAKSSLCGMRFRPGMWQTVLGPPADLFTDRLIPLDELWGTAARRLTECLADAATAAQCALVLSSAIPDTPRRTPFQRALALMERRHGCVSLDEIARAAGLGARQFRRLCITQTGLSPKFLARVLRFRHALSRLHADRGGHAGLAAECGYSDQSHLIAEFRHFSGQTPREFAIRPAG